MSAPTQVAQMGRAPSASPVYDPAAGAAPAANNNAVETLAATANYAWHVGQVDYSYSATPTGGKLTVGWTDPTNGAQTKTYYVSAGGPGQLVFRPPLAFPAGAAVTFTLFAGGASVSGSVYPSAWLENA